MSSSENTCTVHVVTKTLKSHLVDVLVLRVVRLPNTGFIFAKKLLQLSEHHLEHGEAETQFLASEERKRFGHFQLLQ